MGSMMELMNLGMPEMLFIFLLALIVFGPRKLPELARQLGKIMADFKRATNDFKYQLENEIDQLETQVKSEEQEKSRAQKLVDGELTILPPPPPGSVPSTLSTASGHTLESQSIADEHIPEQLSFTESQSGSPEPTPNLQREPNV